MTTAIIVGLVLALIFAVYRNYFNYLTINRYRDRIKSLESYLNTESQRLVKVQAEYEYIKAVAEDRSHRIRQLLKDADDKGEAEFTTKIGKTFTHPQELPEEVEPRVFHRVPENDLEFQRMAAEFTLLSPEKQAQVLDELNKSLL